MSAASTTAKAVRSAERVSRPAVTQSLAQIVVLSHGQTITTSVVIADKFRKRHTDVLRAICNLECSAGFRQRNFASADYLDEQEKPRPKKRKAPEALARSEAQENRIDSAIIAPMADAIKASVMADEVVAATDYPEADRPLFWAAIAQVRDEMPCVRPTWRTINEEHVNGLRTRQRVFRLQAGSVDLNYAVSIFVIGGAIGQIAARWML